MVTLRCVVSFLEKLLQNQIFVCGRCGSCRCSVTQDCCDEISAPQVGCIEMSRAELHSWKHWNKPHVQFYSNRQSDPANQRKRKKAFYPDCLPQFPGEESAKLDSTWILSIEASPLLEASLIGFPYKYQSRQLGLSNVFLCVFVGLTVWKTNNQIKRDGGGSRQSQSVQMLPLAGYYRWSGIHCSL